MKAQYTQLHTEKWTLKISTGNNIFIIGDDVCGIKNIVKCTGGIYIVYMVFSERSLSQYPFTSDFLSIFCVSHPSGQIKCAKVPEVTKKCVALPIGEVLWSCLYCMDWKSSYCCSVWSLYLMPCEQSVVYDLEEQSMLVYLFWMAEQLHTYGHISDIVYQWNAHCCCLFSPYWFPSFTGCFMWASFQMSKSLCLWCHSLGTAMEQHIGHRIKVMKRSAKPQD